MNVVLSVPYIGSNLILRFDSRYCIQCAKHLFKTIYCLDVYGAVIERFGTYIFERMYCFYFCFGSLLLQNRFRVIKKLKLQIHKLEVKKNCAYLNILQFFNSKSCFFNKLTTTFTLTPDSHPSLDSSIGRGASWSNGYGIVLRRRRS